RAGQRTRARWRGDDPHARADRHIERGLAEGRCRAPYDQRLSLGDLQIAEEAGPGRRIGLRDGGQLGPGQIGLDQRDVRRPHAGVFGIAAIDGAPETAHQRGNFGPDWELAAGAGFHQPDAFDADDLRRLGPLASAHVQLGMIETECLDFDDDLAGQGFRLRQIRIDQALGAAELLQDDRTHGRSPVCWRITCSTAVATRRARAVGLQIQETRKSRIAAAISGACVSSAKWPVSKKRTTAPGMSRWNASAPAGRKNGSFLPQTARKGGPCVRKYSWKAG